MQNWEERYSLFQKAVSRLEESLDMGRINQLSQLEIDGIIQRFEFCYELAWKTLKDVLSEIMMIKDINGPKPVITKSFELGLKKEHDKWIDLIRARNSSSHIYNQEMADGIYQKINIDFFFLFVDLINELKQYQSK